MEDEKYMRIAIELAKLGKGSVEPNPLVGAVIVKNDNVISQGFHECFGQAHAEVNAINLCDAPLNGTTMYVTLEPCCHYGKTPPCTELIIKSGISRVVIGSLDPNPLVFKKGVNALCNAGIEVKVGVLEAECENINKRFFYVNRNRRPYVAMKYAMSLDGKIACVNGLSKWITNEVSRLEVHRLRSEYEAIMVGVQTVLIDNPKLDCRIEGGRNPIRIICDTTLKTPLDAYVITSANLQSTIIATCVDDVNRHEPYLSAGCKIITTKMHEAHVCLEDLMEQLYSLKISSVLLEGGGTLNFSALQQEIVNKLYTFVSLKILGGSRAMSPVSGLGFTSVNNKVLLIRRKIDMFEEDILIESEVQYRCLQES